jgi:hypothetical protein
VTGVCFFGTAKLGLTCIFKRVGDGLFPTRLFYLRRFELRVAATTAAMTHEYQKKIQ